MAVFMTNLVGLKVATIDLSDHVQSVTLNRQFSELDVTAMGDLGRKAVKGLETSSLTIDFLNDTAAASVLATLQAAYGTAVTVTMVQTKGTAVSATNPLYTMTCLVNNLTDVNGAVGDISTQSVTWNVNGVVTVATSGTF
jgi:hypothetical protein